MSIQDEAELVMAVRDYSFKERGEWDKGVDITALDAESKEKILLRVVTSKVKSGFIGIDAVRKMLGDMERGDYDKGFLIGKRFTTAAKEQMAQNNIQRISETCKLRFKPDKLYLRISQYVNKLCRVKCGKVPKKESDCKGNCRIRIISDNASFHFENGWIRLMKNDLKQLLALQNSGKV
jgi:hypothetical protein